MQYPTGVCVPPEEEKGLLFQKQLLCDLSSFYNFNEMASPAQDEDVEVVPKPWRTAWAGHSMAAERMASVPVCSRSARRSKRVHEMRRPTVSSFESIAFECALMIVLKA